MERVLFPMEREYVVISIDYRLSTEAIFPAQIHDCKGAIRWVRAHAEEYGIDPERIGVLGTSAGAHLASLVGTSGDVVELEGEVGGSGHGGPAFDSDSVRNRGVDFFARHLLGVSGVEEMMWEVPDELDLSQTSTTRSTTRSAKVLPLPQNQVIPE